LQKSKSPPPTLFLYAANKTPIPVYGKIVLELNVGLRRPLLWEFFIADVDRPIIGIDFLSHYELLLDPRNCRIIDGVTNLAVPCKFEDCPSSGLSAIPPLGNKFSDILRKFPNITSSAELIFLPPVTTNVRHHIQTNGAPVSCRPRRLAPADLEFVRKETQLLLQLGILRPSSSPWASPIHLVKKPGAACRMVGDYRALNNLTVPDSYPLPHIHDFAASFSGCTIFSRIDLIRAYNQIYVAEEDVPKTAIATPFGLFEYVRMPFGLRNSSQTFQRFFENIVRDLPYAYCYLDDLLIASPDEKSHEQHVRIVLQRLQQHGVTINANKSVFGQSELEFLGHMVSASGIHPIPKKIKTLSSYPLPADVESLRKFLGILNFYHRFIPNAASLQAPLTDLIKGAKKKDRTPIQWTDDTRKAFDSCRSALSESACLTFPDSNVDLVLHTDASSIAIGATLFQVREDEVKEPLGFFSAKLSPAQRNYSTYDRELLAIYSAIKHFRHLLEGRNPTIYTDHKPLTFAFRQKPDKASPRQFRYLEYIGQFSTDIRYLQGSENVAADALSRIDAISTLQIRTVSVKELAEAQATDPELSTLLTSNTTSLKLEKCIVSGLEVYCDVSRPGYKRPFVPRSLRQQIFAQYHNLAHTGMRRTRKLISTRFIWPSLNKDVTNWTRSCLSCQRSKITRHTIAPIAPFSSSPNRLEHVHLDLIGPLPYSDGNSYCLTMIDRGTRWPEVVPIPDITAKTVINAFISVWIARFGCPTYATTDQGRQFEAELFHELSQTFGSERIRTCAYHPQANGLIENLHRTLKTAITCSPQPQTWAQQLPFILLTFRASIITDTDTSPAEALYGQVLRLPGDIFNSNPARTHSQISERISQATEAINKLKHHDTQSRSYVPPELLTCSHVFIRIDRIKRSFTPPYEGPFKVLKRLEKNFVLEVKNKPRTVSIDRLKPYIQPHVLTHDPPPVLPPINVIPVANSQTETSPKKPILISTGITRSGRRVKPVVRFVPGTKE